VAAGVSAARTPDEARRSGALRVLHVVGRQTDLVRVAPILRAMAAHPGFAPRLVHTGEPDAVLPGSASAPAGGAAAAFPAPDLQLGVGAGSPVVETAHILLALEPILVAEPPDLVLVAGGSNATLASALAAAKLRIPVAHLGAGLRSRDGREDLNRRLTERLARWLFAPTDEAERNLLDEGHPRDRIHPVAGELSESPASESRVSERATERILAVLADAPRARALPTARD